MFTYHKNTYRYLRTKVKYSYYRTSDININSQCKGGNLKVDGHGLHIKVLPLSG